MCIQQTCITYYNNNTHPLTCSANERLITDLYFETHSLNNLLSLCSLQDNNINGTKHFLCLEVSGFVDIDSVFDDFTTKDLRNSNCTITQIIPCRENDYSIETQAFLLLSGY